MVCVYSSFTEKSYAGVVKLNVQAGVLCIYVSLDSYTNFRNKVLNSTEIEYKFSTTTVR